MNCIKKIILFLLLQSICILIKSQESKDSSHLSYDGIYSKYGLNEREWKTLKKLWKKQSIPVSVYLDDGQRIAGQVISLDERYLTLWGDKKSFIDPLNPDLLRLICLDTVTKAESLAIPFFKKAIFWVPVTLGAGGVIFFSIAGEGWIPGAVGLIGIPAGILPGFLIDILNKRKMTLVINHEVNPQLTEKNKNRYVFYPGAAPGFLNASNFNEKGEKPRTWEMPFDSLLTGATRASRIFRESKWSFSVMLGNGANRFYDKSTHTDIFGAAARYKISNKYYNGNNMSANYLTEFPGVESYTDFEGIKTKRFSLHFDYQVSTPGRFSKNRLEGLLGTSLSLNSMIYNERRVIYTTGNYIYLRGYGKTTFTGLGVGLEAEGSYHFANRMSFFINAEKNFVSPVRITPEELVHPVTGEILDTYGAKKFSQSSFDITFGIAVHF